MTDRRTDGQTDGRRDRQTDRRTGKNNMSPDPEGGDINIISIQVRSLINIPL